MPTKRGSVKIFHVCRDYSLCALDVVSGGGDLLPIPDPRLFLTGLERGWNILSLFLIVLIHEFGHQLACRSVGGKTHDIVLWFLGGVAYVSPPQRPGAQLWSIAAGPLVNVALIPVFSVLVSVSSHLGWYDTNPDLYNLIHNVWWINVGLLIFNMMPVYPLDGGQILRSLLWFPFGRANSLLVATIIGFIGVAGLLLLAALTFFFSDDKQSASGLAS